MTRFIDGPAKGVTLMLHRSPVYLRVVRSKDGKWDALDQLYDQPAEDEDVFVYVLTKPPGHAFIDGPKISGVWPIAEYKTLSDKPAASEFRQNKSWALWCEVAGMPEHLKQHTQNT